MGGTPDCVITASGRTRWVELKCWPEPLNPRQRAWAGERDASGADAVLVLASVAGGVALVSWRWYDSGEVFRGWHGRMADIAEAFESDKWHSIAIRGENKASECLVEKIRPQKRVLRK